MSFSLFYNFPQCAADNGTNAGRLRRSESAVVWAMGGELPAAAQVGNFPGLSHWFLDSRIFHAFILFLFQFSIIMETIVHFVIIFHMGLEYCS